MLQKVTTMKLTVDLWCNKCYKKVKKVYDEENNMVTIKVVCCNPEKLRDKLGCKGCGSIKSIDIVEPTKPSLNDNSQGSSKRRPQPPPTLPRQPPTQPPPLLPPQLPPQPRRLCCVECREGWVGGACFDGYGVAAAYDERAVYDSYGGYEYYEENTYGGCTIL